MTLVLTYLLQKNTTTELQCIIPLVLYENENANV